MASQSIPAEQYAAIESFHADTERLDRHDWRLWSIAALFVVLMFSTIASLALEVEHRGIDFLSGVQLDASVRGLLVMVLVFSLFVVYQQAAIFRQRRAAIDELRKGLSGEVARSAEAARD